MNKKNNKEETLNEWIEDDSYVAENIEIDENKKEYIDSQKQLNYDSLKITQQIKSISEIYNQYSEGKIILSPKFQRNFVWEEEKQMRLIESIILGVKLPPIYTMSMTEFKKDELGISQIPFQKYQIVDGQQRLTTIINFLKNKLIVNGKEKGDFILKTKFLTSPKVQYGNMTFKDIMDSVPNVATKITEFTIQFNSISSSTESHLKYDIFSRINSGSKPLNSNEIRNAIYISEFLKMIKEKIKNSSVLKEFYTPTQISNLTYIGYLSELFAFNQNTTINNHGFIVEGYNSRPKEFINNFLSCQQEKSIEIDDFEAIFELIENNIFIINKYKNFNPNELLSIKGKEKSILQSILAWSGATKKTLELNRIEILWEKIFCQLKDQESELTLTFSKSRNTTSNVYKRVELISKICNEI